MLPAAFSSLKFGTSVVAAVAVRGAKRQTWINISLL